MTRLTLAAGARHWPTSLHVARLRASGAPSEPPREYSSPDAVIPDRPGDPDVPQLATTSIVFHDSNPFISASPSSDPLAASSVLTLDDLTGHELIWVPRAAAPEFYDDALGRLGDGIRLSDISMSHSQLRSALLVRRSAISLGSRRAATPDIVWRPLKGRPLIARYAAVWRTDSHNPVLQALTVSPGLTVVRHQDVVD